MSPVKSNGWRIFAKQSAGSCDFVLTKRAAKNGKPTFGRCVHLPIWPDILASAMNWVRSSIAILKNNGATVWSNPPWFIAIASNVFQPHMNWQPGRIYNFSRCQSRDKTWQPTIRVNLACVPLVCSFRRAEIRTRRRARLSANGQNRKPKDWLAPKTQAAERHKAPLRPGCRSIPAAKFRPSAELVGAYLAHLEKRKIPLATFSPRR